MTQNADNVAVAVTGQMMVAPVGTALPVSATSAINAAFVDLGFLSEDGITETIDETVNDIRAWQGGQVVRKVRVGHDLMYEFTMIEQNADTLKAYYGNFAAGVVQVKADQGVVQAWILDIDDGAEDFRVVIPKGQVTARGPVTYVNGGAIAYPVTVTCYPDTAGVKAYIYAEMLGASA